jgi:hypothetical protein
VTARSTSPTRTPLAARSVGERSADDGERDDEEEDAREVDEPGRVPARRVGEGASIAGRVLVEDRCDRHEHRHREPGTTARAAAAAPR